MTKGPIITIGGNLDLFPDEPILKEIKKRATTDERNPLISIIPSASVNPMRTGKKYSHLFNCIEMETQIVYPRDRDEANSQKMVDRVLDSDAFFFTGGAQLRITALLGGTETLDTIHKKFNEGSLVAGTSAGAVCLSRTMIAYGKSQDSLLHGKVELSPGLSFIDNVILDTHFTARGRFPRLVHVVTEHPGILGVGIGEDTAAIWDLHKNEFHVMGSRNVVVVDGKNIGCSNIPNITYREPIFAEGIMVHILANGRGFDLETRKPFEIKGFKASHPENSYHENEYNEKNHEEELEDW